MNIDIKETNWESEEIQNEIQDSIDRAQIDYEMSQFMEFEEEEKDAINK